MPVDIDFKVLSAGDFSVQLGKDQMTFEIDLAVKMFVPNEGKRLLVINLVL